MDMGKQPAVSKLQGEKHTISIAHVHFSFIASSSICWSGIILVKELKTPHHLPNQMRTVIFKLQSMTFYVLQHEEGRTFNLF